MLDLIVCIWRGICGRCPICGLGRMYRPGSFYALLEGCAQCGRRYEGMGNQMAGAIGISLTLTTFLGFVGGFLLVIWVPNHVMWGLVGLFAGLSIFHSLFYRVARGLWLGILAFTGALDEDDHRDEFLL